MWGKFSTSGPGGLDRMGDKMKSSKQREMMKTWSLQQQPCDQGEDLVSIKTMTLQIKPKC